MLPPYLGAFKRRYPQITISIHEVVENDIYRALKAGECDMGFIVDLGMNDPDLIFETIQEEEFVIIASPDHPLAAKHHLPKDLNKFNIPSYEINNYETSKNA